MADNANSKDGGLSDLLVKVVEESGKIMVETHEYALILLSAG